MRNANKNDSSSGSLGISTIDGSDAQSLSSLAEDLPIEASPPTTPPTRTATMNIPEVSALGAGLTLAHTDSQSTDDMEIKPGIAEMIREEERVSTQIARYFEFVMISQMKRLKFGGLAESFWRIIDIARNEQTKRNSLLHMMKILERCEFLPNNPIVDEMMLLIVVNWER